MRKRILSLLLALCLLCMCHAALAEGGASLVDLLSGLNAGQKNTLLPIDFSGGDEPDHSAFVDWSYEDPTIRVTCTSGREDECDWWMADIVISDASQLRTVAAYSFLDTNPDNRLDPTEMARDVKAVLAINGDWFNYTGIGYIVRQGQTFVDVLHGDRDVMVIDEDGDMHGFPLAARGSLTGTVNGKKIINAFFFGPILVQDGQVPGYVTGNGMEENSGRQRMALCQVGPLHYMAICCAGPARGNYGMTLTQFARFVQRQGVQFAYNLDGGDSTYLIFNYQKINSLYNYSARKLADIIYFASAADHLADGQ